MKTIIITLGILAIIAGNTLSQAPQSFKYQAVARNVQGDIVSAQTVKLRISILIESIDGPSVYIETHKVKTNKFGLINLQIGKGRIISGSMSSINWGSNEHFVKIEIDMNAGDDFSTMGVSQLLSVPYALYAEKSGSSSDSKQSMTWTEGVNEIYVTNPLFNVGIGTSAAAGVLDIKGEYHFPGVAGSNGQILKTNASGALSWVEDVGATKINYLSDAKTSGNSIFLGMGAGDMDVSIDNRNVALGINALKYNSSGDKNTATGYGALYKNTSGYYNTANGYASLYNNITGYRNTASGYASLNKNSEGNNNTANGYAALNSNTTGDRNTSNGYASSLKNITGNNNASYGYNSNYYNENGSNNTIIGYQAGQGTALHSKSGNVFLGYAAGYSEHGSNKLYIENTNSITPLIYGEFDNDILAVNGSLGVGTNSPSEELEVIGSVKAVHFIGDGSQLTNLPVIPIKSVSGKTGDVILTKEDVALDQVENTSDMDKPVSIPTQSALDTKQAAIVGAASSIAVANLVASRVLISNNNGKVATIDVSTTELSYLDGVTGSIQTQLNNKTSSQWTTTGSNIYYNSGNVGINTTNADEELHVEGSIKMVDGNQSDGYVLVSNADGIGSWKAATTLNDGDWTVFGIDMSSAVTGNVGIGTSSPMEKLEVNGNVKANTVYAKAFSSTSPLKLQTDGTTRIYVNDVNGNVGIATNMPSASLEVNGTLKLESGTSINELSTDVTLSGNSDNAIPTEKAIKAYIDALEARFQNYFTPLLSTATVSEISQTSISTGGHILKDGGSPIISRGVCWNTSPEPTIEHYTTSDGSGIGTFTSLISNLSPDSSYYLRAYAINIFDTAYGNEISFQTVPCPDTIVDIRDGNTYTTVRIGSQCWMAENLAYLPQVFHPVDYSFHERMYYIYDFRGYDIDSAKATSNYQTYGVLYNWIAAMDSSTGSFAVPSGIQGVCPEGWHLPSDDEWKILEGEVDSYFNYPHQEWNKEAVRGTDVGGKLKDNTTASWSMPNAGATNSSGFTAIPSGMCLYSRTPPFFDIGEGAYFWSATTGANDMAFRRNLKYNYELVHRFNLTIERAYSVRCVKD